MPPTTRRSGASGRSSSTISKRMKQVLQLIAIGAVTVLTVGCTRHTVKAQQSEADSLILAAQNTGNYRGVIELADSLERSGDISPFRSTYLQGAAYTLLKEPQRSQAVLERVLEMKPKNSEDSTYYVRCVLRMAELCSMAKNYDGVLRMALPTIEWMKDMKGADGSMAKAGLHSFVGFAQYALGMKEEAGQAFDLSFDYWMQTYAEDPTWQNISNAYLTTYNVISPYLEDNDYVHAEKWVLRQDSTFAIISARDDVPAHIIDQLLSENELVHAHMALGQNRPDEARRAIDNYWKTKYSKTTTGKILVAGVLLKAGRYAEAADLYRCLDQYLAEEHMDMSLDVISEELDEKFKANYNAGRRDSALAVAAIAFNHLDSAVAKQKKSEAAEMATIYETQKKDVEIASQKIALSQQRWIGTLAALILITAFFIVYIWYRLQAEKRLEVAHEKLEQAHTDLEQAHGKLQTAYDQLEETTAAKERIESELRIARNIQMSMVPNVFPDNPAIDMFALMTPAKEVGGDLYGYLMTDDKLYFCVGDVSGKGVPASLFMAQATRLFRTLAAQGLMPAEICTRMNSSLADGNTTRLFVTFFIGLVDLQTGHLCFCNCGHNAPIVMDGEGQAEFIKMIPNMPIGIFGKFQFKGEEIADVRRKSLLIYTDGLNEAENKTHEQYGNDRLLNYLRDVSQENAQQVIEHLAADVDKHREGAEPNDDLTMMYLKIN